MSVEEHQSRSPKNVRFGVITVSDSRTEANDTGGNLARELIEAKGFQPAKSRIVKDEREAIQEAILQFLEDVEVDALVLTGGTGISSRDVTCDTLSSLLDLRLDGFGEFFRALSYQEIGPAALLSRAVGGIVKRKPVFALPGSPKAVRLGMEKIILPEIGHILAELGR